MKDAASAFIKWQALDENGEGASKVGVKYLAAAATSTWDHTRTENDCWLTMSCPYVVTSYEADSQLAYLCRKQPSCSIVAMSDNDLLLYEGVSVCFDFTKEAARKTPTTFAVGIVAQQHVHAYFSDVGLNYASFMA
ncbi:hypothetical protein SARC_05401 [Sphaeroforma arctica JP610]|uniref:XPG-I domain-containing protein n=1 Tax=Sphaeroforma arctica JP610 TaxID=667725 RepID=A0A0L0G0C9_9EUKA|nr:hypothetical protein SARC_05401 [Sphaeroforma arctica JP610]KNC82309.1 hypothetical protein SARC_05401 [Sphaeroforma arctica JP610]|eukprot:XP_014156211.1 hypothetical protein SARC_05401 [Sphaeroforma arctica JP610]